MRRAKNYLIKLSFTLCILLLFSACSSNVDEKEIKVTLVPNDVSVKVGNSVDLTLLASLEDDGVIEKDYIKKITVNSVNGLYTDEYTGEAEIVLNADSDGVSSANFTVTGIKEGVAAFEVILNASYMSGDVLYEDKEKTAVVSVNVVNEYENQGTESEDVEVQITVPSVPVSKEVVSQPSFPYLLLPEYINLKRGTSYIMAYNENLQGHSIDYISYGGTVLKAYQNNGAVAVEAKDIVGAGYIKIYLSYPNYFYSASSTLPQENPHGPYYSVENGYLVITYDVNTKEELTAPINERNYYVENNMMNKI